MTTLAPLVNIAPPRRRGAAARAWLAMALALSLLLSQTLGLLHRTIDAPTHQGSQRQLAVKNTAGSTSEAGRFVASLVPKHDDAKQCGAFDELSLGSALTSALAVAPSVPPAPSLEPSLREFHLAPDESKHDFEARAPPVTGMG